MLKGSLEPASELYRSYVEALVEKRWLVHAAIFNEHDEFGEIKATNDDWEVTIAVWDGDDFPGYKTIAFWRLHRATPEDIEP
jgi:hypothetical protein